MKLAEFEPLTEAEQVVIAGLGTGHVTVLGDGSLPGEDAGEDRQVRASLIRWLALGAAGGDAVRLHEKGLRIAWALVVSDGRADPIMAGATPGLDLEGCWLDHDLALLGCRFEHAPVLRGARVQTLNLEASHLPGLQADRLEARGGVFLRRVEAKGEVRLVGARIGGNLECVRARLENADGIALHADGLEALGSVFLRNNFQSYGEVRLLGARIGGDLSCKGGRFENPGGPALNADGLEARGAVFLAGIQVEGEVRLLGARIGGDLDCVGGRFENPGGWALRAQGARVTGAFLWRMGSHADGTLDLAGAEIGHLCDDPACWPAKGDLRLNRCRYGAFVGQAISAAERIRWLDLQKPARFGDDFWPQPWEHCAQVLREMGHAEDARTVLIAKEERQRRVRRARVRKDTQGTCRHAIAPLNWLGDALLGALIAYGHNPRKAGLWLLVMFAIGWGVFDAAHGHDGFKPNNAFILRSPEWAQCADGGARRGDQPSTLDCYRDQPEAAGYPAFNAALYSLDTLVPVVDLEMQEYWVPDEKVADWARYYLWVHIAAGWFLALLAVAGFSGLIDTRATRD
ncbi:hypothetical protein [Roseovarius sp. D22-M7]|uniref:hypothetical protein n=1 Tax=Roseovarius sp. D22-M7 TaxID=3127116 RepID=UPI00300FDFC5